ncbi:MAG: SufE family protein [Candidatus Marinimicrobia bacterium]|nr:SufE family protein [Candidatus Neomarinimicrobiota bacterium]MBL7010824.1 SufE family protein [Candidatus Neomarinimicrobiota bacterium]MBL7030993.1 SufE family protein [Candidatus Neomarinimicrobiota bacterium]
MADIKDTLTSIREDFSLFTDPRDKYVYLVDLAKESAGLNPEELIDENKISGCTSQAWIVREKSDNIFTFRTDSDAMIVKGLLFLIERVFNGHSKEEILNIDGHQFLTSVGLDRAISSQRTNGFSNAIHKIQTELLK